MKTRRVGEARVVGSATGTIVALLPCWCKLKAQLTHCLRRQFYADSNLQVLTPKKAQMRIQIHNAEVSRDKICTHMS